MTDTYTDLGFMNNWVCDGGFPKEYIKCRDAKHPKQDISHYSSGSHHEVRCDICKIVYHYDSSD